METDRLMIKVCKALEALHVRYAIGGSVASTRYGEARFTNDIDIIVDLPSTKIDAFITEFDPADFYISRDAAFQAFTARGQFNIIEPESGLKVDIIFTADDAHGAIQLSRVRELNVSHTESVKFSAIEDLIVKKLCYHAEGGSQKHLRDIASMLKISAAEINTTYVEQWTSFFNVRSVWDQLWNEYQSRTKPR